MTVFAYINGINPLLLYDWIVLFGNTDLNGEVHIKYLMDEFEEGILY